MWSGGQAQIYEAGGVGLSARCALFFARGRQVCGGPQCEVVVAPGGHIRFLRDQNIDIDIDIDIEMEEQSDKEQANSRDLV